MIITNIFYGIKHLIQKDKEKSDWEEKRKAFKKLMEWWHYNDCMQIISHNCIGFEINQEYINIAEARLSAYPKQKLLGD